MALRPVFTLRSPLPPTQVLNRLRSRSNTGWWMESSWRGRVFRDGFELRRVIPFVRNSFAPTAFGKVHADGSGSLIDVQLRFSWFVQLFAVVWFGFMSLWSVAILSLALTTDSVPPAMVAMAVFLPMFGLALMYGGFWVGASYTRDALLEQLDASLVEL